MVTIKQQHNDLLATMRLAAVQCMNQIGHRPGGNGAVGVVKAGGVPFHILAGTVELQCDWVLSFVAGRAQVTGEDLLGMLGRMNAYLGGLEINCVAGEPITSVFMQTGTVALSAGAEPAAREQLAMSMHARTWSIHGQLLALVHGRVKDLIDGGETMESVATLSGLATYSLERIMDLSVEADFVELEETARMLDVSLLLTGAVGK